jgi:hypothetical protein
MGISQSILEVDWQVMYRKRTGFKGGRAAINLVPDPGSSRVKKDSAPVQCTQYCMAFEVEAQTMFVGRHILVGRRGSRTAWSEIAGYRAPENAC